MAETDPWDEFFSAIRQEDWDEAIQSVDALIRKEPSDPDHFDRLGDLSAKDGRRNEAIAAYRKALALHRNAGSRVKAIFVCKKLHELDPGNAEIRNELEALVREHRNEGSLKIRINPGKASRQAKPPKDEGNVPASFSLSKRTPRPLRELIESNARDIVLSGGTVKYRPGYEIIMEGETGDSVFIILKGSVEVSCMIQGEKIRLAELGEGDIFGEMAFLTGRPRAATVTAISGVEAVELRRPLLEAMIAPRPDVLRYLSAISASRTEDTRSTIHETKEKLSGTLNERSVPDMLRLLEQSGTEGILYLSSGGREGTISVKDGMVMDAVFGGARGEDALVNLLSLDEGRFRFEADRVSDGTLGRPVDGALKEGMRLLDERRMLDEYVPGSGGRIMLQMVPETEDHDIRKVVTAIHEGVEEPAELLAHTGLPRIRFELAVAKLVKEGFLRIEEGW